MDGPEEEGNVRGYGVEVVEHKALKQVQPLEVRSGKVMSMLVQKLMEIGKALGFTGT